MNTSPDRDQAVARSIAYALARYRETYGYSDSDVGGPPLLVAFRQDDEHGVLARGILLPNLPAAEPLEILTTLTTHASRFGSEGFLMLGATGGKLLGFGIVVEARMSYERDPSNRKWNVHQLMAHLVAEDDGCDVYNVISVEGDDEVWTPAHDAWTDVEMAIIDALADFTHAVQHAHAGSLN